MWKLKTLAVVTIILGLISLGWIIYDYLALTDIGYNYGADLLAKRRMVTFGFVPIIVFHFSFFATMYLLFEFLKRQRIVIKEHKQLRSDIAALQAQLETLQTLKDSQNIIAKENNSRIPEEDKPAL